MDRTHFSPALQSKIVFADANHVSYAEAEKSLPALADLDVSDKHVRRVCKGIGMERLAERDGAVAEHQAVPLTQRKAAPGPVAAPDLAVVGVDGGRIHIVERPGSVADVSPTASAPVPASFVNPHWIAQLAKEMSRRATVKEPPRPAATDPPDAAASDEKPQEWAPEVASKHLTATRQPWEQFGPMVAWRAWSLGFYGARRKAFLGDGAETNWTLWRNHFSSFEPIRDFIHALTYVFPAALAGRGFAAGWEVYRRWLGGVWKGEVEAVIAELAQRQAELGGPAADASETSPAKVVARAGGYWQHHKERMRYGRYRQQGLPIVSSYVESAVKQCNQRVKGTEKLWRERGAEEMVPLRADYLSDGDTLASFWQRRQAGESGQPRRAQAA